MAWLRFLKDKQMGVYDGDLAHSAPASPRRRIVLALDVKTEEKKAGSESRADKEKESEEITDLREIQKAATQEEPQEKAATVQEGEKEKEEGKAVV